MPTHSLSDSTNRGGSGSTATGVLTGTAAAGRITKIETFISGISGITNVTINGVAVDLVNDALAFDFGGGSAHITFWCVNPTGTTASVVVTGATTITVLLCEAIYGCTLPKHHSNSAFADNTTVNKPSGGLMSAMAAGTGGAITWSAGGTEVSGSDKDTGLGYQVCLAVDNPTSSATGASVAASPAAIIGAVTFPAAAATYTIAANGGSYSISGQAVSTKRGRKVVAATSSYSVTGQTVATRKAWKPTAGAGSYAVTGTAAALRKGLKVVASVGSYSFTGTAVALRHAWKVAASTASYSISGTAVTLRKGYPVVAAAGSYAITGAQVALKRGGKVGAAAGSYSLTGQTVNLTKLSGYSVAANAGSYALSGATVTLKHAWKPTAGVGAYTLTGSAASLNRGKRVTALGGTYALTGTAVGTRRAGKVAAAAGAYSLTGTAVSPLRGRKVVVGVTAYSYSGSLALLLGGRRLSTGAGAYELTGDDVTLDYSAYVPIPPAGIRVAHPDGVGRSVSAGRSGPRIART